MEETKRKLYVERSGFWTEASMLFMILAMVFRVIGSIGRWGDRNYLITLVVLPVSCGLLFVLCLLFFGKRAFWTSVIPVVIGVVFFVFEIMTVEDNLVKVCLISICVVVAVLYAMAFSHPGLKWLLALVVLAIFGYLVGVKDMPMLLDPERSVGFLDGMEEMSVLGILLSLFSVSLAMRMTHKGQKQEQEQAEEPEQIQETGKSPETAAPPVNASPIETPAPAVNASPIETPVPAVNAFSTEATESAAAPVPTETPAPELTEEKPKKLSWREKRQARKEKKESEAPAKEEEDLFPFPMPEPEAEPEPFPPAGGRDWPVSYEESSFAPEEGTEPSAEPEQSAPSGWGNWQRSNEGLSSDGTAKTSSYPTYDDYSDLEDNYYPTSSKYEAPVYPPEMDFGEDPEPTRPEPTDYTPVEEVPLTKKTPFAEPEELYPSEGPAEDDSGLTDL